ncbi:anthrax toxin receptor-like [Felis catus]|uniref:VWFA domain-containing protein n=1 Tax=Felis catus TaxID=9685 RepID=A0ABI7WYB0_FELCA|nr:anthrax toxin receptor-like [Felis catus]
MGSYGLGVPGPALFLLLVLRPPLLKAGSLRHSVRGSRDLHGLVLSGKSLHNYLRPKGETVHHLRSHYSRDNPEKDTRQSCQSAYDLYFILDKSGSVNNNWMDIYNLVEDFVKKFKNPKLRISFITYSTEGHTLMKLTSDKNEISDGLNKLQNTVPTGATNMHEGFKKANEQIEKANSGENKVPSMIISLTDGTLLPESFDETKYEAAKARKMGSTIYAIGVKDYRKDQLLEIADSPEHMIGVDNGFKELRSIVEPLTSKACIEITKVEPLHLCAGEDYEIMISGKGFNNAINKEEVICRFRFSDDKFFDKKATTVDDNTITCSGVMIQKPDQLVHVEVSLNNAISFIRSDANITSDNCMSARNMPSEGDEPPSPAPPSPEVMTPPENLASFMPPIQPIYLVVLLAAVLTVLCLSCCFWLCCCKKPCKEPPVQKIVMAPVRECIRPRPVVVPCRCRGGGIRRIEGKLDTLCDFVQSCNQIPLMWCQPRNARRCLNFARLRPPCMKYPCTPKICLLPCTPKICFPPSQECFPISNCYSCCQCPSRKCSRLPSRMLPLMAPSSRALCGTTLSLPPP